MREQLWEVLQCIQVPWDVLIGNYKATPKGKSTKDIKIVKASSLTNTSNF